MSKLAGKVAIITGATSGMGRRTAERFVEEGARVVVCGRRAHLGVELSRALGEDRCRFVAADVTVEADVERVVDAGLSTWGRIDCLFNNAGGSAPTRPVESIPVADFDSVYATLVRSTFLGIKHVAKLMKDQRHGSIINNGSIAAHRAGISAFPYSVAKAAVLHMTRFAATELGEHNVRVNCISPGAIPTGIFGKVGGLLPDEADQRASRLEESFANAQPLPRPGSVDDIANAAVFLASDDSSFVNGVDIVVDGGLIAGRRFSELVKRRDAIRKALTED
jgi:NAD(P)-dependent dehydrogenase (short-subunit alcohol dehydrogenase family)